MNETDIRAGVLTISDKGAQGIRPDDSGQCISKMLRNQGFVIAQQAIIPDDLNQIVSMLTTWVDQEGLPLIITSGGTGLSPTDLTPQAMKQVIDYEVPGLAEAMRAESLKKTPHAMLSRAIAGVRKASLILNLPGSPRGAQENLAVVLPALAHGLSKLSGDPSECAVP